MKKLYDLWQRVPFRHVVALTLALYVIKEQFPFSNFPMYSNFDSEADVLFIADQNDKPISLDAVFKAGSSTAKKAYKKELGKIANPKGRDSKQSTVEERHAAGEIVLGDWYKQHAPGQLAARYQEHPPLPPDLPACEWQAW